MTNTENERQKVTANLNIDTGRPYLFDAGDDGRHAGKRAPVVQQDLQSLNHQARHVDSWNMHNFSIPLTSTGAHWLTEPTITSCIFDFR